MKNRLNQSRRYEPCARVGQELRPIALIAGGLCLAAWLPVASAQPTGPTSVVSATVTERGPCYRVWVTTTRSTDPATGTILEQNHTYTELANGMHYWQGNQWMESKDLIELTGTGAAAVQGPTKVAFSPNAAAPIVVDLTTASGLKLQGRVTSLHYFDAASGQEATIASIKDSTGVLYPPNQVVYPDAFDNVKADLRYTYTKGAFEQDIILHAGQTLPQPETYGLNSATTRLQAWTEWSSAPVPSIRQKVLQRETDPLRRLGMVAPDLLDDTLDFGDLWWPVGAAFRAETGAVARPGEPAAVRVPEPSDPKVALCGKQWIVLGAGARLIESVKLADLTAKLAAATTAAVARPGGGGPLSRLAGRSSLDRTGSSPLLVSTRPYEPSGLVLDFITLSGTTNSYTFASGTTYYIPSSFDVGPDRATFQTNTCIKYASNAWLIVYGPVTFPSSGPKPVFTSKDDDVYGNTITNSTGVPYYAASQALWMYYESSYTLVQNARFRWAQRGIQYDENSGVTVSPALSSSSFENCNIGTYVNMPSDTLYLTSVTTCNVQTPISVYSGYYSGNTATSAGVVDVSRVGGFAEAEGTIAINPTNPSCIAAFSCSMSNTVQGRYALPGILCSVSTDGGASWTPRYIANGSELPWGQGDPKAAFDSFGNLFLTYASGPGFATNIYVALSVDGGLHFTNIATFSMQSGDYTLDKPGIATGPAGPSTTNQSVWIVYNRFVTTNNNYVYSSGALVTNLGAVISFSTPCQLPYGQYANMPNIVVGNAGEVVAAVMIHTDASTYVKFQTNLAGIQNPSSWTAVGWFTNAYWWQNLPASPDRLVVLDPCLAFDRRGGTNRLYVVYTDFGGSNTNDTDIFIRYNTNYGDGSYWSAAIRVNDDTNSVNSQFLPQVAVDPGSGNVAVCWYDCRNDSQNKTTQIYASVSRDGGLTWCKNFRLNPGTSDVSNLTNYKVFDYGDYTGIDYRGGFLMFTWGDNSNNPASNPDGTAAMDLYVARLGY